MKAFISYSHKDEHFLERLKVHLAPMKRDGIIDEWSDVEIPAGSSLNSSISNALEGAQLFVALVSPDYLASPYCYNKEFEKAQAMQKEGTLMIVPIIVQPCDWKKSPFGDLKALPKDGKAIIEWTNENNAFLNIIDELRNLLQQTFTRQDVVASSAQDHPLISRNYKVKTVFSEVDRLNFKEACFQEILKYFQEAVREINLVDRIQCRFVKEGLEFFTCLISNRANNQDCYITLSVTANNRYTNYDLMYVFEQEVLSNTMQMNQLFLISNDEYEQFWQKPSMNFHRADDQRYTVVQVAAEVWDHFITQVGIS